MYRNLLARAVEVIDEGLVIVDAQEPDQPVIFANRPFYKMTGYPPEEVLGQNCRFLQADDRDQEAIASIRQAMASGLPVRVMVRNYTKAGALFWNDLSITPLYEDGTITHFVGVVSDVTIQRAVNEHKRLLEEHALHTQRLEALGTLASGIAHDVNNSLVPITGLGKLLASRFGPASEEGKLVRQIVSAGERIGNLTQQIVDFSRDTNSPPDKLLLVEEIEQTLSLFSSGHSITNPVRVSYDASPWVLAEKGRLHQVVLNLLTNAAHATQFVAEPEIHIAVGVVGRPESAPLLVGDHYAVLTVRDNGQGMAEDVRRRAIDPFFTTKGPDEGSGMGLAIVHGIVSSAGGALLIESTPEEGTIVRIFWPTF